MALWAGIVLVTFDVPHSPRKRTVAGSILVGAICYSIYSSFMVAEDPSSKDDMRFQEEKDRASEHC